MQRLTRSSPGLVWSSSNHSETEWHTHPRTYVKWRISRTFSRQERSGRSRPIDSRIRFHVHVITRTHLGATRTRRALPARKREETRRAATRTWRSVKRDRTSRAYESSDPFRLVQYGVRANARALLFSGEDVALALCPRRTWLQLTPDFDSRISLTVARGGDRDRDSNGGDRRHPCSHAPHGPPSAHHGRARSQTCISCHHESTSQLFLLVLHFFP
jgi:hypothetical protein